jgi:protein gp37
MKAEDFDTVFYPGGHGPMWDLAESPVRGCSKVSAGRQHCYAEAFAKRFRGVPGHPFEQGFDLRLAPGKLADQLSRKQPRIIFVNSMI